MLKRSIKRRLLIATLTLFILGLFYFFPEQNNNYNIPQNISYINTINDATIFLLDHNDYIARANIVYKNTDSKEKAKEMIKALTIGTHKNDYLPEGFNAMIPEKTKLLSISINNDLCKINFSKDILNIEEKYEEKMIEAIIFSLTTIDDINKIIIFVEGKQLFKLPNSQKPLPLTLTRDYGINKHYDLNNIKNTTKTTIYYLSKYKNHYYYVPVTKVSNNNTHKIEIIINELKSSPTTQTNLISYLSASTELLNYELTEQEISLTFNNHLFTDLIEKNISEEVKYSISLSIKDNFNVKKVNFLVDDILIDNLLLKDL